MNKLITLEFIVDPYQSATCLLATQPKGYRFVKLERAGNKASVTYKKTDGEFKCTNMKQN